MNMTNHCAGHKKKCPLYIPEDETDCCLLRSGGEAAVFSARGGSVLSILSAQHDSASIQAVEMTEDYLLLFCRYTNAGAP